VRRTIDGESCVTALLRAGFLVHHRAHGLALLKREAKIVLVPSVDIVTPQMFDSIARSAGLSGEELEDQLPPASVNGGRRHRR
jgi:hypothetical protein